MKSKLEFKNVLSFMLLMFLLLDFGLLYKLNKMRNVVQKCLNERSFSDLSLYNYKEYTTKSMALNKVNNVDLKNILKNKNIIQEENEVIFSILIPKHACESCFSKLLSNLISHNIKPQFCYIILEEPNGIIEREWKDNGYMIHNRKFIDKIFTNDILPEDIVVLQLGPKTDQISRFVFDPEVDCFEPFFHN